MILSGRLLAPCDRNCSYCCDSFLAISSTAKHKSGKGPRLVVRRILSPGDEDLPAAYDLYCTEITNESERDSFAEIQRWLAEAEEARRIGDAKLDEYLLIAKLGDKFAFP